MIQAARPMIATLSAPFASPLSLALSITCKILPNLSLFESAIVMLSLISTSQLILCSFSLVFALSWRVSHDLKQLGERGSCSNANVVAAAASISATITAAGRQKPPTDEQLTICGGVKELAFVRFACFSASLTSELVAA